MIIKQFLRASSLMGFLPAAQREAKRQERERERWRMKRAGGEKEGVGQRERD